MKRLICIFIPFLVVCTPSTHPVEDPLLGHWMMEKVIMDGVDVTQDHDPENERFFILRADGTMESGGRPYGPNTGRYTYNEAERTLFLDSDAGEEDDSRWVVEIKSDTMTWQGIGTEWAERFQIVQVRKGDFRAVE